MHCPSDAMAGVSITRRSLALQARATFSMRANTANSDMENMAHISLCTWQNKIPGRMTENWSILTHCPEVFFSMLPQVFLLFNDAVTQQSVPWQQQVSWMVRRCGEQSWFGRRTLWIFHPGSWGFGFHRDVIPSLSIYSVSRSFVNTSVDLAYKRFFS